MSRVTRGTPLSTPFPIWLNSSTLAIMIQINNLAPLALRIHAVVFQVPRHREDPLFHEHLNQVCRSMRSRYEGKPPSEIPCLAPAREMYRAAGVDPTRYRPSSEALLRRVLQGKELYRLSPLVDTGNLFSLEHSISIGLYDSRFLEGTIALRMGEKGEFFPGIRKSEIHVQGKICLVDEVGPFGSPSSDSWRTRIREDSRDILVILYAPRSWTREMLEEKAAILCSEFQHWCAAEECRQFAVD
ncbi:MAG: phenylalanine--tRNA ligase beta subunit-related protein [Candidatus Krumholzibacteria bacterium]|nr:phenylalanine--tRNA ligase beta subunit-related protein [Candidatus Krumholzibacteria bacterium]